MDKDGDNDDTFIDNLKEDYGLEGTFKIVRHLRSDNLIYEVICTDCPDDSLIPKNIPIVFKIVSDHECEVASKMGKIGVDNITIKCMKGLKEHEYRLGWYGDIITRGNLLIMEKLEGSLGSIWKRLNDDQKNKLVEKLDRKIELMHFADIGHGDMHDNNILVTLIDGEYEPYIIDWDKAYNLSNGEDDPAVIDRMYNLQVENYEKYIYEDYLKWRDYLKIKY